MGEIYLYRDEPRGRVVVSVPLPVGQRDPNKDRKRGRVQEVQIYASQFGGDFQQALAAAKGLKDDLATRYWGEDWRLFSGRGNIEPHRRIIITARRSAVPAVDVKNFFAVDGYVDTKTACLFPIILPPGDSSPTP